MDVTDYFVMVVGIAVIAIVVYGGYHRSVQNRQEASRRTAAKYLQPNAPAE